MPIRNGKAVNWKVKITGVKNLLSDDNSDKNAIKVGKNVYKILTSKQYAKYFKEFDDLDEFVYIENLEHFNYTLDLLYNYADDNLIWIG